MSYRCDQCREVCNHTQIRVVTEVREREWPRTGTEIAREENLCRRCALIEVPKAMVANGVGHARDDDDRSTPVASA